MGLHFYLKVALGCREDFFGPGTASFLEKVEKHGSILGACQEMGMSYSKGWRMIKRMEREAGIVFLTRKSGGRDGGYSHLTPEGRDFLRRYRTFEKRVREEAQRIFWEEFEAEAKKTE